MRRQFSIRGAAGSEVLPRDATHVPLETLSRVTGIPLIELSLFWEDHLLRGEN